jgi:hypothetical protein
MPTRQRAALASSTSRRGRGPPPPSTQRLRWAPRGDSAGGAAAAGASTSVFHELHTGHWPNQRGLSPPQAVQ